MKRLNINIQDSTYDELHTFIKNNALITTKLSKGTVVTIALELLYSECKKTGINELTNQYLNSSNGE